MSLLRIVLSLSSVLFSLAVFGFVCLLVYNLFLLVTRRGWQLRLSDLDPVAAVRRSSSPVILVTVLLLGVVGGVNTVAATFLSRPEIGAFYEESEYQRDYEALLHLDATDAICIVTVSHWIDYQTDDRGRSDDRPRYALTEIHLPYGRYEFIDEEYYPEDESTSVSLGEHSDHFHVTLLHPADDDSWARLETEVLYSYGELSASRNSDVYHFEPCSASQRIKPENLIYFVSEEEAHAFGYRPCELCEDYKQPPALHTLKPCYPQGVK